MVIIITAKPTAIPAVAIIIAGREPPLTPSSLPYNLLARNFSITHREDSSFDIPNRMMKHQKMEMSLLFLF
jgi:hypothetical protein